MNITTGRFHALEIEDMLTSESAPLLKYHCTVGKIMNTATKSAMNPRATKLQETKSSLCSTPAI